MRVPSISTYVNATYRLGNLTSDLESANEVVSTQKQINEISDDPLGLSQVLSLQNTLGYLEQIEQNVSMGRSWIQSIEGALDSVNDLMLDIKTDVARLANASMSADERNDAIALVEHGIEQIVALGNTQINGNYIFGGTDTDKIPLEYDKDLEKVSYKGNDIPFEVRTDKNLGVEVGRDGKKTFWDQEIQINSTNNTVVFTEDNGHGSSSQKVLTAVIEDGLYSKEDLTTVLKNALNDVSASEGYGVVYKVDYNEDDQQYSIREDGTYSGFINTEFLWESGGEPFISNLASSSSINPDDINIDINNSSALSIDTPIPHGTEPFRLTWQGDNTWSVENNPGYTILPFDIPGDRDSISIDFNESGTPDITIQLDKPVTEKGQFIEFDIVSAKGDSSVGHEIGFKWDDSIQAPPVSDVQAKYVNELIIEDGLNDEIVFEEV
ncbi:flagellar hook-associated protein FlgL, partial [bacterium]|nr:flagellar hook-associated protein FlgL [bacterium]